MKRTLIPVTVVSLIVCVLARGADEAPRKKIRLPKSARAAAYVLRLQSNEDLVRLMRSEPVHIAILQRAGLERKWRDEAVAELAKLHQSSRAAELIVAIVRVAKSRDDQRDIAMRNLAEMLLESPRAELEPERERLVELAADDHILASQIGLAALVSIDGGIDKLVDKPDVSLTNLLHSIALLQDDVLAAGYFELVQRHWHSQDKAVREAATSAAAFVAGKETETLTHLHALVAANQDVTIAIESLGRVPLERWPQEIAADIAATLTDFVRRTPASQRTISPAKEAALLAEQLAATLPADVANEIRASLGSLSVKQYLIHAPLEKMAFEPNVLVVAAGKPMEIVFSNEDDKPHNFLLAEPGRFEDVGLAAQAMATTPEGQAKHYVPDGVGVLQASTMIWPEKSERISFTAPDEPGVYPYVCTFPGHWLKMYGAMVVVTDVDEYLANNQTLPTADELLGKKTVRQWTYDDLAEDASRSEQWTPSFERGRRLFAKVSCVSCHKVGKDGLLTGNIGPELTSIAKKYPKMQDMLREIVEPSRSIEDKYASVILIANGKVFKGVVVDRNETQVTIKENPLLNCEPTVIDAEEIEDEEKSKLSPMPEGLLNSLYRDEIFDLLAFVYAGGDANHPLFRR